MVHFPVCKVLVTTRGYIPLNPIKSHETTIFLWFSYGFPMVSAARHVPKAFRDPADDGVQARTETTTGDDRSLDLKKQGFHGSWKIPADYPLVNCYITMENHHF